MANSRVSLRFIPDEYDLFVKAIGNDERLPATYDEWRKSSLEEDATIVSRGDIVNEVVVHYQYFTKYARDTGLQPSYDLLLVVAIAVAAVARQS